MEAEVDVRGPVLPQMNVAINLNVREFELGLTGNTQVRPLGHRVNGEVAGTLLIEGKIVEMNGRVEGWLFCSAGTIRGKIRPTAHGNASALQNGDAGQIKLVPGQVKAKGVTRSIVGGAAGD